MSIRFLLSLFFVGSSIVLTGCSRDPIGESIAQLHDPSAVVRRKAAKAFVEHPANDERAIAELIKSTSDKDAEVRYQSVDALGKLGPAAQSSLPLLRLRLEDTEKDVRIRAAFAIQKVDPADRTFLPVLTSAMREGDGRTLLEVGALGPSAAWAVPTLVGLLSHESSKVRTLAAKTLGNIGPAAVEARPALETAQRDSNPGVKKAASEALAQMRNSPRPPK